jgi:hypothetical protein
MLSVLGKKLMFGSDDRKDGSDAVLPNVTGQLFKIGWIFNEWQDDRANSGKVHPCRKIAYVSNVNAQRQPTDLQCLDDTLTKRGSDREYKYTYWGISH